MTTTATNSATITADLPDFASDTIDFVLLSTVAISSTEIFPGKTYTMTLDANGVGSTDLPTPDGTGTLAWLWEVSLPDGREANVSIAWSAVSQDLATILAAEQSSTTPSSVATLIANKQDKDTDATDGNMAFFSSGQTVDAGFAMSWNADDMTVNIPLNANVTLQTGQEFVVPVDNKSGVDITNGQVVKLSGAVGNKITIELAQANNVANARQIGVATEDIANNASGFVTVAGFVRDWNTSSYSEGDVLYLSLTTPGAKTTTKPIWPDIAIEVETIVKVHVSDGVSWVGSYETGAGAHEKAAAAQAAAIAASARRPAYPLATTQTVSDTNDAMLYMPQDDYKAVALWTPAVGQILTVSLRWKDADNRYFLFVKEATDEIFIYRRTAAAQTSLGSKGAIGLTAGVQSTIEAIVRGTTITVWVDGTFAFSIDDTDHPTGRGVHMSRNSGTFDCDLTVTPFTDDLERYASVSSTDTLRVFDPQPYQIQQRNSTTGDLLIHGAFNYAGGPYTVEASFNGGSYQDIATGQYGGLFSGTLPRQAAGTGTLTVRLKDVNPAVSGTVANVGVGDVYLVAGQSNPSGRGVNPQSYTHGSLIAAMLGNDYQWKNLADPTDSTTYQVDTVSGTTDGSAGGSIWPLIAQDVLDNHSVPVAFIPCALGGSSIDDWRPGTDHENRATLYGSMVYRAKQAGGVKSCMWWQGEADPSKSTAEYYAALMEIADALRIDLDCTLMPCKLQDSTGVSDPAEAALRAAVALAWANSSNVTTGPDLSGLTTDDAFHLTSDVNLAAAAALWYATLATAFYS